MNHSEIVSQGITLEVLDTLSHEITVQLLQTTTKLALIVANTLMEREIVQLAGLKSQRKDRHSEYYRHSSNPGSVRINHEKVPVNVPRARHRDSKKVVSPEIYHQLHNAKLDEQVARRVIAGVSTRDFDESSRTLAESFGLSKSAISQDFVDASAQALEEFQQRDLSAEPFVALFIDGKTFADELIILALGVTKQGYKQIVGMTQAPGESSGVVAQMLNDLMDRGFSYEEGLLCISDGSKGIAKAIHEVFGNTAAHQRCRIHKIKNVVEHLAQKHRSDIREKLWDAYNTDNYRAAKRKLVLIVQELRRINPSAAASLEEGMDETLTLQRLNLNKLFSKGFGTTNCIESVNSQLEHRTSKVKNWREGNMRQRWVAQTLLRVEKKLNRVANYKHLGDFTKAFTTTKRRQ